MSLQTPQTILDALSHIYGKKMTEDDINETSYVHRDIGFFVNLSEEDRNYREKLRSIVLP